MSVIGQPPLLPGHSQEPDFKQLVIALALQYLKQKSEPELSAAWSLPKACGGVRAAGVADNAAGVMGVGVGG